MDDRSQKVWIEALGGSVFGAGHIFEDVPVLHHYTTLQGLVGIVQSQQIWATDMRFLNDITEANRIWSFITKRVEHFLSSGRKFQGLDLQILLGLLNSATTEVTFVASFSEARDSLGQWRAYGGSGGVCIAFKKPALNTQWIANPNGREPHWTGMLTHKVKYVPANSSDLLDAELERLFLTGGPLGKAGVQRSNEEIVVAWVRVLGASFKHEAFAEEKEWRICFQRHAKPMRYQRFRIVKSGLIPYIAADLNVSVKKEPVMSGSYIAEVIVGPSANMELTGIAVRQLLLANGHEEVPVHLSEVPYKDW